MAKTEVFADFIGGLILRRYLNLLDLNVRPFIDLRHLLNCRCHTNIIIAKLWMVL
jgi:hypothetical protein